MEQQFKAAERQLFIANQYYDYFADLTLAVQWYVQDLGRIAEQYSKAQLFRCAELMDVKDPTDAIRDPFRILYLHISDVFKQYGPTIAGIKQELDLIAGSYRLRTGMSLWDQIQDLNDSVRLLCLDSMSALLSALRAYSVNSYHCVLLRYKLQGEWSKVDVEKVLVKEKMII